VQEVEVNGKAATVRGHDLIELTTSKQLTASAEDVKFSVSGKRTDNFTGPKGLLPTNAPLHERSYTPNFPGLVAEEVTYEMGDREETFQLGSHSTSVLIGDMSYETELGTWKARALQNTLEISAGGITGDALTGNVKLNATAGAAIMKGSVIALVESQGPVHIKSGSFVLVQAQGQLPDVGPVMCSGSREPFTNLPFATWGLGHKNFVAL